MSVEMNVEENLELFKLDTNDRKVLFWLMDTNPQVLQSWIEYIAAQYSRKEKVVIDSSRLFEEVIVELPAGVSAIGKTWRPKRILLVDDESIFNFLHKRALELTGVTQEVYTALNGRDALNFLDARADDKVLPDVILLDLTMPIMDGFAFLEAFRKMELPGKDNIAIIVITSSINQRDRVKAQELGITDYLIKPVDEIELCAALIGK